MGLIYGYKYTATRNQKSIPADRVNKVPVNIYNKETKELLHSLDSIKSASILLEVNKIKISYYGKLNRNKELNECKPYKDVIICYNIKSIF